MVIVIRALQGILLFFAFGAAVTAFVVGVVVVDDVDACVPAPVEGSLSRTCSYYEAKASAAFGIGASAAAAAAIAVALNGMARPKPQVQNTFGSSPQPSGQFPQQLPPYGPPR